MVGHDITLVYKKLDFSIIISFMMLICLFDTTFLLSLIE